MIDHWFNPDEKTAIRPDRLSKKSLWHTISFLHEMENPLTSGDLLVISFDRISGQRIKKQLYQFNSTAASALHIVDGGFTTMKDPEVLQPILNELAEGGVM